MQQCGGPSVEGVEKAIWASPEGVSRTGQIKLNGQQVSRCGNGPGATRLKTNKGKEERILSPKNYGWPIERKVPEKRRGHAKRVGKQKHSTRATKLSQFD